MMDFISQHFVDVRIINGGFQVNLSYAMIVLVLWMSYGMFRYILSGSGSKGSKASGG